MNKDIEEIVDKYMLLQDHEQAIALTRIIERSTAPVLNEMSKLIGPHTDRLFTDIFKPY